MRTGCTPFTWKKDNYPRGRVGSENGCVEDALRLSVKYMEESTVGYHDSMTAGVLENWFQNNVF